MGERVLAAGYAAGLLTDEILGLTPAEVYAIANARAERQAAVIQRTAWITASLTGFAKVPAYEKCFPSAAPAKPKSSTAALFAYFADVKAERAANRA